jgi:hypothetical protein
VIKKSLCTLYCNCNHQVHRDFLITLYFHWTNQLLKQYTKKNGCCSNNNSVVIKTMWLKLEVSRHSWGTEGLTSRILALVKTIHSSLRSKYVFKILEIGFLKYIVLWSTNDMLYWKCHPMRSINPKLISTLPTVRIPSVLGHVFSLHTWKLYSYKAHFQTSTPICAYILPGVSHFQPLSSRRFTHFNICRCSLLPQFIFPKMSVKYHAMWYFYGTFTTSTCVFEGM